MLISLQAWQTDSAGLANLDKGSDLSIIFRASTIDTNERYCQKIKLHRLLSDLGVQRTNARSAHGFLAFCCRSQNFGRPTWSILISIA